MARAGLGGNWECLFANDIDPKKAASYAANWGSERLTVADVADLRASDLPGRADLAWASFPCQDLSLAGNYAGLAGRRSGTFWPFWRLIEALAEEGRAPAMVALENVCGALTSHGGADFAAIGAAVAGAGYRLGALVIDAARFVPQSRPRLFIVAVRQDRAIPPSLIAPGPDPLWHPDRLLCAWERLPNAARSAWVWWRLPEPRRRECILAGCIEEDSRVAWHTAAQTQRLLELMSPVNRNKVTKAETGNRRAVGCVYRRTRKDGSGARVQRAEVRFDGLAGCLRTPAGGSSRQTVLIVEGQRVRSRLLSAREATRLMGLPNSYKLPREIQRSLPPGRRRRSSPRRPLSGGEFAGARAGNRKHSIETAGEPGAEPSKRLPGCRGVGRRDRLHHEYRKRPLRLQNHVRHPILGRVSQRQRDVLHAQPLRYLRRHAMEPQRGLAARADSPLRNPATARRAANPCRWPSSRLLWPRSAPRSARTCWPCAPRRRSRPACRCARRTSAPKRSIDASDARHLRQIHARSRRSFQFRPRSRNRQPPVLHALCVLISASATLRTSAAFPRTTSTSRQWSWSRCTCRVERMGGENRAGCRSASR